MSTISPEVGTGLEARSSEPHPIANLKVCRRKLQLPLIMWMAAPRKRASAIARFTVPATWQSLPRRPSGTGRHAQHPRTHSAVLHRQQDQWERTGITGATVIAMVIRGLIERDAAGELTLTKQGRAVLAALLMAEDD